MLGEEGFEPVDPTRGVQIHSTPENERLFGESHFPNAPLLDFPAGARVVDIGCGSGRLLSGLQTRGVVAIGVEPVRERVLEARNRGFQAIEGFAERLPFRDGEFDGVLCNVSLPYTDEVQSVAEWSRVLRPGGQVRATLFGFGYALWLMTHGPGLIRRLYGVKMVAQTWLYRRTGKFFFGNPALCQTTAQMLRYYAMHGLSLRRCDEGKRYLGFPVIIFHLAEKTGDLHTPDRNRLL